MDLDATVRTLLRESHGDALCNACLAFACATSLTDMWQVTAGLLSEHGEFASVAAPCASCHRVTTTFACLGPPKCAHCSRPIDPGAAALVVDGDRFHRSCWQLLLSDERVRISRSLGRQSRELIARARLQRDQARASRLGYDAKRSGPEAG
jgi:hypothetical protein